MKAIKLLGFFLTISMFIIGSTFADVLFHDDFEAGEIDAAKWDAAAAWQIIDNDDGVAALGAYVLDCLGGNEALSVMSFPEEYDYFADFKSVNGLSGFIFQAQDTNNIYMHQVSVTGSSHTPNHVRWHSKVAGGYAADPLPFEDGVDRETEVWYRAKFEVRGANFKLYLGDAGAATDDLSFVSEWTHADEAFTSGKIGIRMSGSEHAVYDNIMVVTAGFDPVAAVDSHGKVAQTWGALKK